MSMDNEKMLAFLKDEELRHREAAAALSADSRGDEAAFEKIRANVFGIFAAVLQTALKVKGAEAESFFAEKLRDIPSSWRAALAAAREKGDSSSALTEKLKLESVAEIERVFEERGAQL